MRTPEIRIRRKVFLTGGAITLAVASIAGGVGCAPRSADADAGGNTATVAAALTPPLGVTGLPPSTQTEISKFKTAEANPAATEASPSTSTATAHARRPLTDQEKKTVTPSATPIATRAAATSATIPVTMPTLSSGELTTAANDLDRNMRKQASSTASATPTATQISTSTVTATSTVANVIISNPTVIYEQGVRDGERREAERRARQSVPNAGVTPDTAMPTSIPDAIDREIEKALKLNQQLDKKLLATELGISNDELQRRIDELNNRRTPSATATSTSTSSSTPTITSTATATPTSTATSTATSTSTSTITATFTSTPDGIDKEIEKAIREGRQLDKQLMAAEHHLSNAEVQKRIDQIYSRLTPSATSTSTATNTNTATATSIATKGPLEVITDEKQYELQKDAEELARQMRLAWIIEQSESMKKQLYNLQHPSPTPNAEETREAQIAKVTQTWAAKETITEAGIQKRQGTPTVTPVAKPPEKPGEKQGEGGFPWGWILGAAALTAVTWRILSSPTWRARVGMAILVGVALARTGLIAGWNRAGAAVTWVRNRLHI